MLPDKDKQILAYLVLGEKVGQAFHDGVVLK